MIRIILSLSIILLAATGASAQFQFETVREVADGYSIAPQLGDYDGDGDIDILGTGQSIFSAVSSGTTVLFRNDGDEFVRVELVLTWFYYGGSYSWADLDNDNDLDIVGGGCPSYCYNSKGLYIYRNDGGDQFTLVTHPTNLIGGKVFSFADYNNDGLIDIEVATQSDNNDSVIGHTFYKNTGNFIFQETFELPVVNGEGAWGDLNNDGWSDFVLFDKAYENLGDGTFAPFDSPDGMQQHVRHFIFDADQDGDQDVVTSNGIMMENDGDGTLTFGPIIVPYEYINELITGDFDGDGNEDMIVSGGNSFDGRTELFRSNGDGTFSPEGLNEQYADANEIAAADMDNDNDPDIVASGVWTQKIIVLQNDLSSGLSKPGVPGNLQTSATAGAVTFSWDAATDNEQSSLNYNMYLTHGDDFIISPSSDLLTGAPFIPGISNVSSALEWTIATTTLPDGYYQWSVQSADNEFNASMFAAPREFTLYKNNPANAPTGLVSPAMTTHSVFLEWIDNSSNETSYTIERSSLNGNSGFEAVGEVTSNTVAYLDNTVGSNRIYYYRVRLNGPALAYTNVIRIETDASITVSPTNLEVTSLNSASLTIGWEYAGSGITGFVIERSYIDKKHFIEAGTTNATTHTFTDQQLETGRNYYYRVAAVNGADVSDHSDILTVSTPLKEFTRVTLPSLTYESNYHFGGIAWGDYDSDGDDDLLFRTKPSCSATMGTEHFMK